MRKKPIMSEPDILITVFPPPQMHILKVISDMCGSSLNIDQFFKGRNIACFIFL